jgi:hypothetical protein
MRAMPRIATLLSSSVLAAMAVSAPVFAAPVFINEIHYDNASTDVGEAIEIAGPAGVDVSNWSLVLYNGNGGAVYNTMTLAGVIPDLADGYGVLVFNYPVNGLQNGSPDGVALVDAAGVVQQFLSYEGVFTAVGGAVNGITSTDIGVMESGSEAAGMSLQLSGSGTGHEDFAWNSAATNSFGVLNPGQSFGITAPPPPPVSACGQPATLISQIQGSGDVSLLLGQTHAVEAIVVGDFQGGTSLNGFYIEEQAADQDTDVTTSEGLFVASNLADINVGDVVRVNGVVTESFGLTSLSQVASIEVCASGASVTATNVNLPFDPATNNAEWFEGMKVVLPQTLTVSENYNLGRYGEVVVSSGERLMIPTQVALSGVPALALKAQNNLNRLVIDDGLSIQNPDPVIFPAPALSASNTLRSGDSVTAATGVLSYGFSTYRLEPTQPLNFTADNARTLAPANLTNAGSLRVASFNVLNFFNGDGLGGGFPTSRGASTLQEFERQKAKIVDAISTLDADVIGLMEIENDGYGANSAIAQLVNALNAVSGAGTYAFVNPGVSVIGTDEIAVGMLYKSAKVTLLGNARILDTSVDARFLDTKNRPVLAQTLRDNTSGKSVTVAVNHLKSKGSACDDLGDADLGDGQGNCNITRTQAAQALADWLASNPTSSNDQNYLIIGDLNSYAMEDPITALRNAGYTNLIASRLGANAYSYVYAGESGYLDHALASASLVPQVTGITEWHINADEPHVLDYNVEFKSVGQIASFYNADAYRSSDHDPVLVELLVAGDLDNDGDVDNADYNLFRSKLGCCAGGAGYLAEADYDHSSCVNYTDYRIWYSHYQAYRAHTAP